MGVSIKVDPISFKRLNKRFKLMGKAYPEETFRAIVKILFDIKLIAQRKIKADGHIVTSRLRNSLFVKTLKQKFAKQSTNKKVYTFEGGSANRDLSVALDSQSGAAGTNVLYAQKIEDLDSYLEHAVKTVDVNKRFQEIPGRANKRIK
jgi:hypothetical protein